MTKIVYERDMYPYVRSLLRKRFSQKEGREIHTLDNRGTYITDFTVDCVYRKKIERIIVEVKRDFKATQKHVNQLNLYARKMAGKVVSIKGKILIYPAHADVKMIPDEIKVIKLREIMCKQQ